MSGGLPHNYHQQSSGEVYYLTYFLYYLLQNNSIPREKCPAAIDLLQMCELQLHSGA